jgi:hypothetical protein
MYVCWDVDLPATGGLTHPPVAKDAKEYLAAKLGGIHFRDHH